MNAAAVRSVLIARGYKSFWQDDIPRALTMARVTLSNAGANTSRSLEDARLILAAAADAPAQPAAPAPAAITAPAAPAKSSEPLLGVDSSGRPLSVEACEASGLDSLTYLSAAGNVLTAEGQHVLDMLSDLVAKDPKYAALARARELGIDVAGIRIACTEHNARHPGYELDFSRALAAEISNQEMVAADRAEARVYRA